MGLGLWGLGLGGLELRVWTCVFLSAVCAQEALQKTVSMHFPCAKARTDSPAAEAVQDGKDRSSLHDQDHH